LAATAPAHRCLPTTTPASSPRTTLSATALRRLPTQSDSQSNRLVVPEAATSHSRSSASEALNGPDKFDAEEPQETEPKGKRV